MAPKLECPNCGSDQNRSEVIVRRPVEKTSVVVTGHERIVCAVCGTEVGLTLHRAGELARIVMGALVRKPRRLTKEEFEYLRRRNGWKSNELAASLGVTPSTVSRWESGAAPILPTADRALRLMVVATGAVGLFDVGELGKIDDTDGAPLEVEIVLTEAGWMPSGLADRKAS